MTLVIKRSPDASLKDLVKAIDAFVPHLTDLDETDAARELAEIKGRLERTAVGTSDLQDHIAAIIDTFDGEHELSAYIINRKTDEWSQKDLISQAAARVLALARRLKK